MFKIILILLIIALLVLGILWWTGVFSSDDNKSPISKNGKIDQLDCDNAGDILKKNGFKQSDEDIRNVLALSYIYAGLKSDDIKTIVNSLGSKDGKKKGETEKDASTTEGSSDEKKSNAAETEKSKDKKSPAKDKDSSKSSVEKIEKFNKEFKKEVFGQKDGVDKILKEDYKNKCVKSLLLSLKDVDTKTKTKETLKAKVPDYEKIIKKYKVERINKDNKDLPKLSEGVLLAFVNQYEKILKGEECK